MALERRPAVFLDKDGTLVENVPYNVDPDLVRLSPGAGECLRLLHARGYELVVVTNQSGVARGIFPESALRAVESRLRELAEEIDVPLRGFYYCPHEAHRDPAIVPCGCRKPAPGLIERAAGEHNIDLRRSWLIGDIMDDIEAGRRAGCRTVLVRPRPMVDVRPWAPPDFTVRDLAEAASVILAADAETRSPAATAAGRTA